MAARWRWTHPNRHAGNSVPVASDAMKAVAQANLHVAGVGADMQPCVDQTILAIFEDSALMSEGGNGVDDESEKLLSALSEMLDAVEADEGNLSPFDTLPDTELLDSPKASGSSQRLSLGARPGPTSLKGPVKTRTDGEKKESKKKRGSPPHLLDQQQALFCSKNSRAEAEVQVFNSTSLINLVKIMHPYCLKLHVEEDGERLSRRHAFFSQEQVWKYERPKEGSDEEINVVSDDDERPEEKTFLRSVLRNEKSPQKRKSVSFGAVQVASFEESLQARLYEQNQKNPGEAPTHGAKTVTGSLQEAQNMSPDVTGKKAAVVPLKKAKSLSLQQYRQRQQARAPLVGQSDNYTAQWPSVSGTPQELAPILTLQGPNPRDPTQRNRPATVAPSSKLSACLDPSRIQRSGAASRLSPPHRLLSATAADPNVATKSKRSPQKKALVSSDPPNPVVLALPVSQTSPWTDCSLDGSRRKQAESSGASVQLQHLQMCTSAGLLSEKQQHSQAELAHMASGASSQGSAPDASARLRGPSEQTPSLRSPPPSSHTGAAQAEEQRQTEADRKCTCADASAAPGCERALPSSSAASGIEASDLTSLLEQFEETQAAKEEGAQPSVEVPEALGATGSAGTPDALRMSCRAATSQAGPVPKPLGSDVIIDMQTQLLTSKRPKTAPSKGVQIIAPRPLPNRKTQGYLSGVPAVLTWHVSSDHDYCRPHAPPHGRAATLRDVCPEPRHAGPDSHHRASTWNLGAADSSRISESPETRLPGRPETGSHTPTLSAPSGSEERAGPWPLPTPPPSPPYRGRDGTRCWRRAHSGSSSCSSSSSSSPSPTCSPKRHRGKGSGSSSCSRSPSGSHSPQRRYRWSRSRTRGSRSRSTSWSRSRSPAPREYRPTEGYSSSRCGRLRTRGESRRQKLQAMDERRVVYVGRICGSMTHDELRERFLQFGQVECVSLHFRETGDHYGFVTFYNVKDAFAAIDNGSKLRRPDEKPFDLCFGGRRQFCPSDYTDLDADREMEPSPARSNVEDLDFDQLLQQAQGGRQNRS